MQKLIFIAITVILFLLFSAAFNSASALPAFPGAEGFGADTVGGRGGKVYFVSNLNDSGPGSLRAALEASGPRIVVFTTGGTITTKSTIAIKAPYITIAGQTAPGGGITLKSPGHTGIQILTHNVVLRYLTIRNGSGGTSEALAIYNYKGECYNIVIDHCSLSWATDEVAQTWYKSHDITYSWNIISEGLDCSTHAKGCHSKGLMFGSEGSEDFSIHHNLFAHNVERNPIIQIDNIGSGKVDVINNVFYNAKSNPVLIWDRYGGPVSGNFMENFHKLGNDSSLSIKNKATLRLYCNDGSCSYSMYIKGNLSNLRQKNDLDEKLIASIDSGVNSKWSASRRIATSKIPITNTEATKAYNDVLGAGGAGNSRRVDCSGNWSNRRDSIDVRVIDETKSGSSFKGTLGSIINDELDVGGWVLVDGGSGCKDTDRDGMPDAYEKIMGFNINIADANADANANGYTNIEEYINGVNPSPISTLQPPINLRTVE